MKNNFNVIGDIAGQYKTLQALLAKMPQDAELLSLGDPNDRGPASKEVIEFLMKTGRTVFSNHAHLMTEAWMQFATPGAQPMYYEPGLWPEYNGGIPTMQSYKSDYRLGQDISQIVPREHIMWLKQCPMWIESEDYVYTHAPLHSQLSLTDGEDLGGGFHEHYDSNSGFSLIWNRYVPDKPHKFLNGLINVFGHNSSDKVKLYTTQYPNGIKVDNDRLQELIAIRDQHPIFAICLDTSSAKVLTGMHMPDYDVVYARIY